MWSGNSWGPPPAFAWCGGIRLPHSVCCDHKAHHRLSSASESFCRQGPSSPLLNTPRHTAPRDSTKTHETLTPLTSLQSYSFCLRCTTFVPQKCTTVILSHACWSFTSPSTDDTAVVECLLNQVWGLDLGQDLRSALEDMLVFVVKLLLLSLLKL